MEIKESEATFDINSVGENTKQTYLGKFKVKCMLSPLEEIAADKRYRDLLGTNSHLAAERVRSFAFALSQLEQRVLEYPPFWENNTIHGGHVEDNIVLEVLDKAVEAQEKYLEQKKQELEHQQKRIADMMKNKDIEKEPEMKDLHDQMAKQDEEIDLETE